MPKFIIKEINPTKFQDQIVEFWKKYLPKTNSGRIEWLEKYNPAGKGVWLFAYSEANDELAGILSIIPRTFYINGDEKKGGMLGDFMVADKYRVFGPAIPLQKYALSCYERLGFDFLYTISELNLKNFFINLGYQKMDLLYRYVKPISLNMYLEKYFNSKMVRCFSFLFNIFLKIIALDTYILAHMQFEKTKKIGKSFDHFWSEIRKRNHEIIGDRSSVFLNWRYVQNKHEDFIILKFYDKKMKYVIGYIIYTIEKGKIHLVEIYDFMSTSFCISLKMIKLFTKHVKRLGADTINFRVNKMVPMLKFIRYSSFFDSKDYAGIFFYSNSFKLNSNFINWGEKLI